MAEKGCCRGEPSSTHPRGMHSMNCKVCLANADRWQELQATQGWKPGDPVHPELTLYGSCGPCLVRWTAEVDRCPECGELSTEALRRALART